MLEKKLIYTKFKYIHIKKKEFFIVVKHTYITKFTILTTVPFSGIKYIHIVVQLSPPCHCLLTFYGGFSMQNIFMSLNL